MFLTLARLLNDPTLADPAVAPDVDAVLALHPVQLSRWLEQIWASGGIARWPGQTIGDLGLGSADVVQRLAVPDGLVDGTLQSGIRPVIPSPIPPGYNDAAPALGTDLNPPPPWDHLIWAYLSESAGPVEVFREVVRRFLVGETLGPPQPATLAWVLTTEQLFFSANPLLPPGGRASSLRPEGDVVRRRAYWRDFGLDLPHGSRTSTEQDWKRDSGPTVNLDFMPLMSELLRLVAVGIENDRNAVGANPTDPARVAQLCQTIGEILRMRRRGGMLAAEEFWSVSMLSWFRLVLETDNPVIQDLKAIAGAAGNPADRLAAVAGQVGMVVPTVARAQFELADLLSPVLWFIELGFFDDQDQAELLFRTNGIADPSIATHLARLINFWQVAMNDPVKATATTIRPGVPAARPFALPAVPAPGNGVVTGGR